MGEVKKLLSQYPVTILDPSIGKIIAMNQFIHSADLSILEIKGTDSVTDISDVSIRWDMIFRYIFEKEKDALMFALKFDGKMR